MTDFVVNDCGSICILMPMNENAGEWVKENLHTEESLYFGDGIAVEPRYMGDILEGLRDEGFEVAL